MGEGLLGILGDEPETPEVESAQAPSGAEAFAAALNAPIPLRPQFGLFRM